MSEPNLLTGFIANPNHKTWGLLTDYLKALPDVARGKAYLALYETIQFRYLGQILYFSPWGIEGDYVSLSRTKHRRSGEMVSIPVAKCQLAYIDPKVLAQLNEAVYPYPRL